MHQHAETPTPAVGRATAAAVEMETKAAAEGPVRGERATRWQRRARAAAAVTGGRRAEVVAATATKRAAAAAIANGQKVTAAEAHVARVPMAAQQAEMATASATKARAAARVGAETKKWLPPTQHTAEGLPTAGLPERRLMRPTPRWESQRETQTRLPASTLHVPDGSQAAPQLAIAGTMARPTPWCAHHQLRPARTAHARREARGRRPGRTSGLG